MISKIIRSEEEGESHDFLDHTISGGKENGTISQIYDNRRRKVV